MKSFTVTGNCDLKSFTGAVYPQGSFCLAALLRDKDIKVNGVRTGRNVQLKKGDEVIYYTTPKQEAMPSHYAVYEDNNVYVADKLSGVETEGLLSELCGKGEFYAVHRLDRNTQGIIIFAKNKQAEEELIAVFRDRRCRKTYLAKCKDNFKKQSGVLTAYLQKDAEKSEVKIYDEPRKGAAEIVTEYRVISSADGIADVEIVLHTGRTHQIRAHMAYIGCPVLGDEKYGDKAMNNKFGLKRQRLVSKSLQTDADGIIGYLKGRAFQSRFTP